MATEKFANDNNVANTRSINEQSQKSILENCNKKYDRYLSVEEKELNGIQATVKTASLYPWTWRRSANRPKNYYEQQSKVITYYKSAVDKNNQAIQKKIEIEIPRCALGENRKRVMNVKIDGEPFYFYDDSILDMSQTFNIPDVNLLLPIAEQNTRLNNHSSSLRAIAPYIYLPKARGDEDHDFNLKNNGDIIKSLSPFIQAMSQLKDRAVKRELLIPVVTKGEPHHWNLCVLSIDQYNIPSLSYIESTNLIRENNADGYLAYLNDYVNLLLPSINMILALANYPIINNVDYHEVKQFSEEGCGITMSLNVKKLLEGTVPDVMCKNVLVENQLYFSLTGVASANVSMEEDAITRVELAFKIHARESIIAEQNVDEDVKKVKSLSCRGVLTHPLALKAKAKEAFMFFNVSNTVQASSKSATNMEVVKHRGEASFS